MTDQTYSLTFEDGVTQLKFHTAPTLKDAKSALDDIARNFPYEKRLIDLTAVPFSFSTNDIAIISEYGKRLFTKPNRLAIVAIDTTAYCEMRLLEVFRKQPGLNETRVFNKKSDALQWLAGPGKTA